MDGSKPKKYINFGVFVLNIVCVVLIVALFANNSSAYSEKLHSQNITDISNLNRSSAALMTAVFSYQSQKLTDTVKYIETAGLDLDGALDYIYDSDASETSFFELVGTDAAGVRVQKNGGGAYIPISYADSSYRELQKIFSAAYGVSEGYTAYTPEFTDGYDAYKCFAFYTYLPITDAEGKSAYYTLMYATKAETLLNTIKRENGYEDFSTVLTDSAGNYIIGSPSFKSDNFYQYIYVFNNLTLDEKYAMYVSVITGVENVFYYKNSAGADCVYVCEKITKSGLCSISCVPLSSFHNTEADNLLTYGAVLILAVMMIADITWMNDLNRKLRQSIRQEKRANAAKSDFLARMSHEIRTPMNAIIGLSQLGEDAAVNPDAQRCFSDIHDSGVFLLGLINDILDMSRIERGKMELHEEFVNGPDFLRGIAVVVEPLAKEKNIRLKTDMSKAQTPWVKMDKLRSQQIYINILNNAIKFSPPGSTVEWSVTDTLLDDTHMHMVAVIRDHGCGMSPEFIKHIFEPFTKEHNGLSDARQGTGLGLAIVKSIVDKMNGTIRVESVPGKGTSFIFELTREYAEKNPNPAQPEESGGMGGTYDISGCRILLCEDHPLNRDIAVKLLEKKGCVVECAENGAVGLEKFSASPERYYNCVLMDIRMPVMNGLDAARAIRALDRKDAAGVPIIAMSANAFDEDVKESLAAGMNRHLAKPVEPETLYSAIAEEMKANRDNGTVQ